MSELILVGQLVRKDNALLDGVPMLQIETHRYDIELMSEDNETPMARHPVTVHRCRSRSAASCTSCTKHGENNRLAVKTMCAQKVLGFNAPWCANAPGPRESTPRTAP